MFKLQRLEITGFKSFADYTEIVFTGSGITAVVGPNGCGKSNVSDSIAWVLGEQRAKSLRGEEMKDVVFQGTSKRQASGMAEVVLHLIREESEFSIEENELEDIDEALSDLDEKAVDLSEIEAQEAPPNTQNIERGAEENGFHSEDVQLEKAQAAQVGSVQTIQAKQKTKRHWRPRPFTLDFAPGEAVSVTRRLYLSGESEYLLNGKTCRLRDIQDLFSGTGLSGAHYALIEQGRIGQILSAKPSDRRNLIEEAAGISKFRTRQRAAEARLESAKTNLSRISDIVSEVDKQANALRRQAAKTRRYKVLREEFRVLLRRVFTAEGKYLTELVAELEEKLIEAVKTERDVFAQVNEKDESFRGATKDAREAEENLSVIRQKHAENALERDRNLRERRYKEEQIAALTERSGILKSEIEVVENRLSLVKTEIVRLEKEEQKERDEAEKAEIDFREAESKYRIKLQELARIEKEIEAERAEVLQHTSAVERFAEIERQLGNTIERFEERIEGLRREGERAGQTFAEHREESIKLEKNLAAEREKLTNLQIEKQSLLAAAGEARSNLQSSEKALNALRENFSGKKHRLETLRELEEKRSIYAPTIQKLFAEEKKIGVKFLGTLADRLDVDEKAERAVENLFGLYLQTILVETEDDARKTVAYLKENDAGRIAVLVQSPVPIARRPKDGNRKLQIAHLIGVSDDFAALLQSVFPREMGAEIVENLGRIEIKTDEVFVDFAGDLSFGGKLFVSGKTGSNEKNTSLLAFKRKLRELETETENLAEQIGGVEKKTNEARAILAEREEEIINLQSLILKVEREILSQEIQVKSLVQETERAERHKKVVNDEIKQIETESVQTRQRRKEAQINTEKAESARITSSDNLNEISRRLSEARRKTETENVILNEKRTLAATSSERRRSAQTALHRVENEQAELDSRLARQRSEILETEGKAGELTQTITEVVNKIALSEAEQENEQNELTGATSHLKFTREQADTMSAELAGLNKRAAEARNERAALEIRQTEAITKLRSLNEKSASELNLSLVGLVENEEVESDFDLESSRAALEDLREKLDNFGAINMLALEELSETEERLLFLTSQRQDIIDGIESAETALREIKERSREKFREAFEAINSNFTEFFVELFGGGRGEMSLLEADDVLEAGIEIVAQPPGKRLQSILLLSGGEKAMTAIALVMAIFRYRPAPFCLLDEVDAPLDDANVGRFVNKIAEMSEKTQFIVITHNKRTMEAAKALYGVTMQEAGVSKVVSVRFE